MACWNIGQEVIVKPTPAKARTLSSRTSPIDIRLENEVKQLKRQVAALTEMFLRLYPSWKKGIDRQRLEHHARSIKPMNAHCVGTPFDSPIKSGGNKVEKQKLQGVSRSRLQIQGESKGGSSSRMEKEAILKEEKASNEFLAPPPTQSKANQMCVAKQSKENGHVCVAKQPKEGDQVRAASNARRWLVRWDFEEQWDHTIVKFSWKEKWWNSNKSLSMISP